MTWLRKTRSVLIALALAVGIGCLIGARELTHGGSNAAAAPIDAGPRAAGGPVVLGLVDTDPAPVNYGLPPVLQSGTVAEVFVKEGDEVKAGQKLYQFDDTIQRSDVKRAEAAVAYAETKVKEAETGRVQHAESLKVAQAMVDGGKQRVEVTAEGYRLASTRLETLFKAEGIKEADWPARKNGDPTLFQAKAEWIAATNELTIANAKHEQLKTVDPEIKVKESQAAVEQAKAELAKAQKVVDLCVVKAKMPGTIEQISISPGTTLGISTRTPALWLIPAGSWVVRAEVEAEFAHRVGPDLKGKTVTITDHTDPKLTYSGVVRRIPRIFLLKRSNAENFLGGDTRVLEVVIEVSDPAPAGKPPLAIGQRVRVNLGQ
ncbi:HlyD family secretion protein [Frigoriglobus tundricola]|uniref:YknX-like barrel-sandwich hybrid domain-containing protein n=1 Tax=Frigoriglobus tundricola TaxID=2774151 RepID=A0A6M5YK52_9BACT|nr:biotin/lipoyl-binding protein [Frigoriglobus tundricola]QJW94345.1 hypothetical protein FTUN_1865 [Frigoriglobus tundricola]